MPFQSIWECQEDPGIIPNIWKAAQRVGSGAKEMGFGFSATAGRPLGAVCTSVFVLVELIFFLFAKLKS